MQSQRPFLSRKDPMPHVRPAGKQNDAITQSVATSFAPSNDRPLTPPEQRRFRRSFREQPGTKFINAGLVQDPIPAEALDSRFGMRTEKDLSAADLLNVRPKSPLQEFMDEQREIIYKSKRSEPLGRTRIVELPEQCKDKKTTYGISTVASESAKTVIYDHTDAAVNGFVREVDLKQVTKPVDREYNWAATGLDPKLHRFGKAPQGQQESVADALSFMASAPDVPRTEVGSKRVLDARRARAAPLGAAKSVSTSVEGLAPNHTFGKAQSNKDAWNAAKCITGQYTPAEQQPDADLGKSLFSLKPRMQIPADQEKRTFGIPSIRTDRKEPARKSIADAMNFGNELNGKGLLYPSPGAFEGLDQTDFVCQRDAQEIRRIFETIGHKLSDDQFGHIAGAAQQKYGVLSVDSFRKSFNSIVLGI